MEFLKELFNEPLTYDAFETAVKEKGYKLVDLNKGEYVAKGKLLDSLNDNKELKEKISSMTDEIKELKDGNATAEDYKAKLEALQKDIAEKEQAQKEEAADEELTQKILAVFPKDKQFTSEYVRNGLIADIKARHAEDNTKGLQAIFDELTNDKEGIFASQNPGAQMGGMGNITSSDLDDAKIDAIMGITRTT